MEKGDHSNGITSGYRRFFLLFSYVNPGNIPVVVFRLCLRTSAVSSLCVLFVRVLPRSCASKIKPPGLDSSRKSSLPCHLDSKHFHQNVAESLLGEHKVLRFSERRFGRRSLQFFDCRWPASVLHVLYTDKHNPGNRLHRVKVRLREDLGYFQPTHFWLNCLVLFPFR